MSNRDVATQLYRELEDVMKRLPDQIKNGCGRWAGAEDHHRRSHRLIGVGEYWVTSGTWIVASFGKDRQKTTITADTLVAQTGAVVQLQ